MGFLSYTLGVLRNELTAVDGERDYVIFGSASLVIRGIIDRLPEDIDVMVSRRVWGALLPRATWSVLTPTAGDPPILEGESEVPIHAFFDWADRHVWMDVSAMLRHAEIVNGWRVVRVEDALRHKQEALAYGVNHPKRQRHLADIALIENYLRAVA